MESLRGKHVLVTGGSSGIGLAVAKEVAFAGAHVTLISRNKQRLVEAKSEVQKCCQSEAQNVIYVPADVSKPQSINQAVVDAVNEQSLPPYMIVCSAGLSISGTIGSLSDEDIIHENGVNYLGTVFTVRACLPHMKSLGEGRIILVSSLAGMAGLYGYTTYSASKFALRGFAEALTMELHEYNIKVTVSLPPNTDTPGYHEEIKTIPLETKLITNTADTVKPEVVAKQMLKDSMAGRFYSTVDFEGQMLTIGNPGMAPPGSVCELVGQVMLGGLLRVVSVFYLFRFNRVIESCRKNKDSKKKSD